MNNAKKSLVPHRRFKEFQNAGAWEQRKFMDLIDSIIDFRGRTPKKLGMNWSNEGLLALSAQNVKDGYIDKTIDAHYGSQTLYDKWMNGRELHKGQVVFTTEAPMGNVARIPDENKYILSQRTIAFTVKNTVLTEGFLMYLLESPSVKNNLLRISSGGTAKGVSQKTLSSLTVKIPTSLKEQERINFVFYSLDSLITLHQRKLNKLKKLKSAYLTEMFPDEGEHKPKRRFAGFTDDWEQRKLGEVVKRETCQVISSNNNPSVEYDDVVSEQGELNKDVLAKHSVKKGIQFNKNHILYGKLRPYLHNWLNPNFKGVAVGDWWVLKPKNDIEKSFLYALIQTQRYDNVANISTGSKMPRADWNLVSNTNFAIPSQLDEQLKIGEVFSQLDSLIALHQRKIDKLQKLKNAYLNEMFV